MYKKLFTLLAIIITNLLFLSCQKDDVQNLDINVSGKVSDQVNNGVANVIIYIQRGKGGNYAATVYNPYQTVTTDASGNYSYLVKNDGYEYQICCGIPAGYLSVDESCKKVDKSIIDSKTVPNIINFKLTH